MSAHAIRNDQRFGSPTNRLLRSSKRKNMHRLYMPYSISNAKSCNVSAITYYEMDYGVESKFEKRKTLPTFSLEKHNDFFYFKVSEA